MISSHSSPRFHGQCPGDRDPLLLAAGQLPRIGVRAVRQPDAGQQLQGSLAGLGHRQAQHVDGGFHHVAGRRQVREQLEVLEDHPEQPADLGDGSGVGRSGPAAELVRAHLNLRRHRSGSGR